MTRARSRRMRLCEPCPAPIVQPAPAFEGLREITAVVGKRPRVPPDGRALMREARMCCQVGGAERTGAQCLSCHRIVSIKPSPGRSFVTVRCRWTDADVVEDVMTHAHAIVPVPATATSGRCDELAARARLHHVLVAHDDDIVGAVCRCHLAEPGSRAGLRPVSEVMDRRIWTIPPGTNLGAVVDVMARVGASILAVAVGQRLLGTVTHRELGAPDLEFHP